MRQFAWICLLLTLPVGVAVADTPTRIGVIDSQRIFSEYQEAKDAEAIFQQEMQVWQKELEDKERTIVAKEEQIRSQSLLLSKEKLDELQREHETLLAAYNKSKADILDPKTGKAVMRNQELSRPINEQISKVVEQLGAEGKFALIIDLATTNAVYLAEGIDLTDSVLAELAKGGS